MARTPLIAGNWKMNLNHFEAIALVQKIAFSLPAKYFDRVDVAVIPPFTDLRSVQTLVDADKLLLSYGAQDVSPEDSGAHTGDISPLMLAKLGCTYVVVGHSERRDEHHEDDALVATKAAAVLKHGMTPIVCVGESLEVREAGEHRSFVVDQVRGSLAGLTAEQVGQVVLAYEPVWAIGSGRTASPDDAQEICGALRAELIELGGQQAADTVRVLYGGSVTSKNIADMVAQPDVDGALVGGASIKADEFATLCAVAAGGPLP